MSTEEKGLALWGGVDLDLSLNSLQKKVCAVCGKPATVAIRKLDQQVRTLLCETHRTAP